jgi:fibronectin-binding autotransporter adhesin
VISGTGAVQQAGAGMLILNGAYAAGPLTVAAGVLAGTGTVSAAATVAAGGTLQPGTPAAAGFLNISSVTFAAGAQFNPLLPGTGTLLRVTATNGLTLPAGGGVATVNVVNASLAVGTYPILDYAGAVQGGDVTNLVLGTLPPRTVMYLTNNTVNTSIDLVVVTAGEPIKWLGNVNGLWNIEAPTNWVTTLGGLPTAYLQAGAVGDALQFDDTAAGNFTITLQTNVSPSAMLVSNDANDYAIGGGFGLGGAMALRKFGTARLTLETSNSFAGGILVAGGTLQLGNGGVGGAPGAGPISNNASLVFVPGDTVSVAAVISGAGTLTKAGAGKLTLAADNTYTGATVVNRGVLEFSTPNFNTYRGGAIAINSGSTVRIVQTGGSLRYDFPGKTFAFDSAGGGVMELGAALNFTFTGGGCTFTTAGGAENRLQGLSGVNMANNPVTFAVEPGTDAVALAVSVSDGEQFGRADQGGARRAVPLRVQLLHGIHGAEWRHAAGGGFRQALPRSLPAQRGGDGALQRGAGPGHLELQRAGRGIAGRAAGEQQCHRGGWRHDPGAQELELLPRVHHRRRRRHPGGGRGRQLGAELRRRRAAGQRAGRYADTHRQRHGCPAQSHAGHGRPGEERDGRVDGFGHQHVQRAAWCAAR